LSPAKAGGGNQKPTQEQSKKKEELPVVSAVEPKS